MEYLQIYYDDADESLKQQPAFKAKLEEIDEFLKMQKESDNYESFDYKPVKVDCELKDGHLTIKNFHSYFNDDKKGSKDQNDNRTGIIYDLYINEDGDFCFEESKENLTKTSIDGRYKQDFSYSQEIYRDGSLECMARKQATSPSGNVDEGLFTNYNSDNSIESSIKFSKPDKGVIFKDKRLVDGWTTWSAERKAPGSDKAIVEEKIYSDGGDLVTRKQETVINTGNDFKQGDVMRIDTARMHHHTKEEVKEIFKWQGTHYDEIYYNAQEEARERESEMQAMLNANAEEKSEGYTK